jgi:hypothetical protein
LRKNRLSLDFSNRQVAYTAFFTFPERMQAVQTRRDLVSPSTTTLTFCRLGSQRRLVILWEWLTLWPYTGLFPHISHTFAMAESSFRIANAILHFFAAKSNQRNQLSENLSWIRQ